MKLYVLHLKINRMTNINQFSKHSRKPVKKSYLLKVHNYNNVFQLEMLNHLRALSFIHTNSSTFSSNYVSVF